ncbi:hypothetical protein SmJEL517_g04940 [Synchytrium microbalum]|uniref:RRM domain-containing protein n=1 Tax=Synchytrium microbalum TaxID=1806994 RepID=A0A507C2S9_9FUNG|nr:uncharacterized protein SmJEL517_g04940 [Synchytrium microbalum]TPX31813.1 hypothetical protein SmJEL517_g04940 [Synchytrium microbalum]
MWDGSGGHAASYGSGIDSTKTTLWMGDLESWMDEAWVRQLWYSMGENVSVKMIRDKFSGGSAGYCFVDFGNPQSAMKHLQSLNGTMIPQTNRVFKLNWASGGGMATQPTNMNREERGPEFSIFVGDLGPEVTDFMLLQTFQSRYMSCKSAKVVTDPMTGQSRGYGFVRFTDEAESTRSMSEMSGQYCGSRPMRISIATPKAGGQGGGAGGQGGGGGGGRGDRMGGMGGMGGAGGMAYGAPMGGQQAMQGGYNQYTDPNNTTVFVGGLSQGITEDDLRTYFGPFGEITYTKIPPGKGCGFVQFTHRTSAEAAIAQMNGYVIGSSRVRLSWGRSQIVDKPVGGGGMHGGQQQQQQPPWGGGGYARPPAQGGYMQQVPYGAAYGQGAMQYMGQQGGIPAPSPSAGVAPIGAIGGMGGAPRYDGSPAPQLTAYPQSHVVEDPLAPMDVNQANESFINAEEAVLERTELGDGNGSSSWRGGSSHVFAQ